MSIDERKDDHGLGRYQRRPEGDSLSAASHWRDAGCVGRARGGFEIEVVERIADGRDRNADEHWKEPLELTHLRDPRAAQADGDRY
jgi:hypothetical protein